MLQLSLIRPMNSITISANKTDQNGKDESWKTMKQATTTTITTSIDQIK